MIAKLSIRAKITIWFSVALILMVAINYLVVLAVSDQVIQKTIRDNLITTVENNVDEVEYYSSLELMNLTNDVDSFLRYKEGFIEIDDDFLDEVNQVYTALYLSDGSMLYGENPIARESGNRAFADLQIQRISVRNTLYYVFDRRLIRRGLEDLWLRGIVSETQGAVQMSSIARTSLVILPGFVLFTIIGGYLIAARMLYPIRRISESALQISQGGDLKKRIELGKGKDELHQLANHFNHMFKRLDRSFQTEQQFTSDASHELRTPVAVILAQCELSLDQEGGTDACREALTVILRQARKMSKMISDMLDFTRLEQRTNHYEKSRINLSELVESVCRDLSLLRENNISLEFSVEPSVGCMGSRDLLARLLSNLICNAYRYGKENGHIYVLLKEEDGEVHLSVKDDGIGISEEEQRNIFKRFYQVDKTHAGTGLGLAMAGEIAHFHGGEITVESSLGKGSVFTLKIPNNQE